MSWQVILALAIVIPVILIPVLFVWYLNIGGIFASVRERQAAREQSREVASQHVAVPVKGQPAKK